MTKTGKLEFYHIIHLYHEPTACWGRYKCFEILCYYAGNYDLNKKVSFKNVNVKKKSEKNRFLISSKSCEAYIHV